MSSNLILRSMNAKAGEHRCSELCGLTSQSLRATIGPLQANRSLLHYVIGISGILPYNRNVTLQTLELFSPCTVLSHGSIMLPPRQPRIFALGNHKNYNFLDCYLSIDFNARVMTISSATILGNLQINKVKCKGFHTIVRVLDANTCRAKY